MNRNQWKINRFFIFPIKNVVELGIGTPVKEALKWKVVLNTANDPIHGHFDFDQVSSERIEYFQSENSVSIKTLIPPPALTYGLQFPFPNSYFMNNIGCTYIIY